MFYILCFILFFILVPFLISKLNSKWRDYLGYGIPLLLLLGVPYWLSDYSICGGWLNFCSITYVLAWIFGISAFVFAFIYTSLLRKLKIKPNKKALRLMVDITIVLVCVWFFVNLVTRLRTG